MPAPYDAIARAYKDTVRDMPMREMLEFAFQQRVGDVAGTSVLDLACGNGAYTRSYRLRGATRVVGVDISESMIALARTEEEAAPCGVEYVVGDAKDPGKLGDFDLVTATFFLHYAVSSDELLGMCRRAHENLKPGGRFITLNNNVLKWRELDGNGYEKYGISWRASSEPLQEGGAVRISLVVGENRVAFDNHFLEWSTYRWAFETAGFQSVEVHDSLPLSPALEQQLGREYWTYLLENPAFIIIECRKE
jgi:SAM-dependent methyltransferase